MWAEIVLLGVMGFIAIVLAGLSCRRSTPSENPDLRRLQARIEDGFGGAKGFDNMYSPAIRGAAMPFPVRLRRERKGTRTYEAYKEKR